LPATFSGSGEGKGREGDGEEVAARGWSPESPSGESDARASKHFFQAMLAVLFHLEESMDLDMEQHHFLESLIIL
jgi:hypothetical protein